MDLSPVHAVFWSSFLVLWAHRSSQSEARAPFSDLCQDGDLSLNQVDVRSKTNSSGQMEQVKENVEVKNNFSCLLYPTNTLNCSWSFRSLPEGSQVSGAVIICERKTGMPSSKYSSEEVTVSEEGVQSQSVFLHQDGIDYKKLSVILRVNVSLPDAWTIFIQKYNTMILEVLSPPPNITVVRDEGGLLVTWARPSTHLRCGATCFEYQLDISGQDELKTVIKQLNYTEPNADPKLGYRVRMRTRKNNVCRGSYHWSDWSHFVTVPSSEPAYKLNSVVIILISLGIPMILLALLLLLRLQRVSELLFPPIPRPSKKYKNFLEKTDTFLFYRPVQPPKYEEEITEVEETQ